MELTARAEQGVSVVFRLFQGEFQVGGNIPATESTSFPGFYSADIPANTPAGEYRLEGDAGPDPLIPVSFAFDGTSEITLFDVLQDLAQLSDDVSNISGGGGGGLTAAQDTLLTEIRAFSRIASLGAIGKYIVSEVANTGTLFDETGNTPLKVFDLKDASGAPSTEKIFQRIPR